MTCKYVSVRSRSSGCEENHLFRSLSGIEGVAACPQRSLVWGAVSRMFVGNTSSCSCGCIVATSTYSNAYDASFGDFDLITYQYY